MKLIDARTMSRLTPSQHNEMMPVLTLEQRRIFIAVAERQHITRAAEAFNLTHGGQRRDRYVIFSSCSRSSKASLSTRVFALFSV